VKRLTGDSKINNKIIQKGGKEGKMQKECPYLYLNLSRV
jgi:hypothetical protein